MYPAMGDTSYNQLLAGSVIRNTACTIRRRGRLAVSGVSVAAAAGRLLQPGRRAAKWLNANAPTRPVEAGRQSPASPTATALPWANCFVFTCTRKPPTATDQLTTNQLTNQPTNGKAYYHSRLDSTRDHSTQLPGDEAFYLALSRSCGQFDRPSLGRSAREARPPAPNMHGEWVGDLGWVPAAADREAVQRARGQPHTTLPRPTAGGRPPRARVLDADRACEPVRLVSRHVLPADGTRAAAAGHSAFWRDRLSAAESRQASKQTLGGLEDS
jgi:hypothetical protein